MKITDMEVKYIDKVSTYHPIPSHTILSDPSCTTLFYSFPSYQILRLISSHSIPSHLISLNHITSHHISSHLISSHLIKSHLISSIQQVWGQTFKGKHLRTQRRTQTQTLRQSAGNSILTSFTTPHSL